MTKIKKKESQTTSSKMQWVKDLFERGNYHQLRQVATEVLQHPDAVEPAELQTIKDKLFRTQNDPRVLQIGIISSIVVLLLGALAIYVSM